jgi:molybdate transport repressor ModE-like protein
MRFDLIDLRLFLLVIEAGSITHGATQANLSLPSASARLRGMEEMIGHPLLERGRRGVEPTPAGDALAHHARIVLRQIEQMRGELGEYSKGLIPIRRNYDAKPRVLEHPFWEGWQPDGGGSRLAREVSAGRETGRWAPLTRC